MPQIFHYSANYWARDLDHPAPAAWWHSWLGPATKSTVVLMRRARTKLVSSRYRSAMPTTWARWASIAGIAILRWKNRASPISRRPRLASIAIRRFGIPVRRWNLCAPAYRTGESIQWTRVHDLPDFVYFNHSIHVDKGVGCESCHGRVDKMPLMWKANTLEMSWCLDCHRNPQKVLRPLDQITTMGYVPDGDQEEIGRQLMAEYHTPDVRVLTSCSTCHR